MALASDPSKCTLDSIVFTDCICSQSALEQRLVAQSNLDNNSELNGNTFNSLSYAFFQQRHLLDSDIRIISRHPLQCLKVCPCMLTNKSVGILNKNSAKNLKYLRIQNYCNNNKNDINNNDDDDDDDDENENENGTDQIMVPTYNNYNNNSNSDDDNSNEKQKEENDDDEEEDNDAIDFDLYLQEYLNYYDENNNQIDNVVDETLQKRIEIVKNTKNSLIRMKNPQKYCQECLKVKLNSVNNELYCHQHRHRSHYQNDNSILHEEENEMEFEQLKDIDQIAEQLKERKKIKIKKIFKKIRQQQQQQQQQQELSQTDLNRSSQLFEQSTLRHNQIKSPLKVNKKRKIRKTKKRRNQQIRNENNNNEPKTSGK
jgi:hypothetical protein